MAGQHFTLSWLFESQEQRASTWVRVITGAVFLLEGMLKFVDPAGLGAGRFAKIGFPAPEFLAQFDGSFEILCGTLLILGLLTRLAAIPMVINMLVAIVSTKLPLLMQAGFWKAAHEARLDFTLLFCCLYLVSIGGGCYALDSVLRRFLCLEPGGAMGS